MKRTLFAVFLAVMLVAALVFITAPEAKAEDAGYRELTCNTTETIDIEKDTVLNLAGFNATVSVAEGVTLSVIDTSFMLENGNIDFTGDRAGDLTIAQDSSGTVADISQYGDYRYLKVTNNDGTYSFHPFNMAISQRGINVTAKTVSLEAKFIANNVVRDMITDFGVYKANGEVTGCMSAKKTFGTKNGVIACYDLTGSLNEELLGKTRTFSAYIKIDGMEEPILAKQEVDVTPANVLVGVGNAYKAGKYTGKSLELALDLYYYNPELQQYLTALETTTSTSEYKLVTNVNELAAGDKVVIVAKDSNYAMSTTQNSNNRGQASVTKSGNTVSFGSTIQVFTLVTGKSADTFAFYTGSGYLYAASSSSNYLRTETTLSNNSSWKITIDNDTALIVAQGSYTRNTMQYNQTSSLFACYSGASQKALAIYKLIETSITSHTHFATEENQATCTARATCKYCNESFGSALSHTEGTAATCQKPAVCASCKNPYGDPKPDAHNFPTKDSHTCANEGCTATSECIDTDPQDNVCDICQASMGNTEQPDEPKWTLLTDVNDLKADAQIVIVAKDANYAMSATQNSNNRAQATVTKDGNFITFGSDVQILTLKAGKTSGTWAFYTGTGYLYAASSSKNYLKTEVTLSTNSSWSISVDSSGVATIKATGSNTRNWLRYNSSNNPPLFSCYGSGQADVAIYILK